MSKSLIFLLALILLVSSINVAAQLNDKPVLHHLDSLYRTQKQIERVNPNELHLYNNSTRTPAGKQTEAMPVLNIAAAGRTNTICYDTSSKFYFKSDSLVYYPYTPVASRDGNLLVSGMYVVRNAVNKEGGFLLKMDYRGNILWSKLYDSTNHQTFSHINYYTITELADGSLMLGGGTENHTTGNTDLLLTHTDANGNIIWNKNYKSRIWTHGHGSLDYFYIQQMTQDPYTGHLYLCGPHWENGRALLKVDITNGNIVWSNLYEYNEAYSDIPFGFEIRPDEIRYFGKLYNSINVYINMIRINKQTGDTIATKMIRSNDTSGFNAELLGADQLAVLSNGNYLVGGICFGSFMYQWNGITPLYQGSVVEIDSNLNFVRAHAYRSAVEGNMYNTCVSLFPDGSGLLTYLKIISNSPPNSYEIYYVQFKDGQILRRRKQTQLNEWYSYETLAMKTADDGDLLCHILGSPQPEMVSGEIMILHKTDTASECLGLNDSLNFSQPVSYEPYSWRPDIVGYNVFSETPQKTISVSDHITYNLPGCSVISHCDSVFVKATPAIACPGQPVIVTIRKNRECGTEAPLLYNTSGVQSVTRLTDSTYQFIFTGGWSGYIHTQVEGCEMLKDSVFVHVSVDPPVLDLGPDISLCPGNTIVLSAGNGFVTYEWQDGSADSIYTVTQPGKYYVTVTSPCSGVFSDTVIVIPQSLVPLSIGPDRTMCLNDTIHLNAPGGFLNYKWLPNYNINSTNTQNVVVSPAFDTAYTIKAEKTPGCFGFDTVHITVYQSPPINLGNDKSFCAGDSTVLDAGPGFSQYQWKNGSTTQQITVYTQGTYSVTGTTAQGCRSIDTMQILNVFPLPVVSLNPDSVLCADETRILDAGNGYVTYNWNNGTIAQTININTTGWYAVMVTDNNGCKGTDTTIISRILPLPVNFLGPDTVICSYGNLQLKALKSFNQYLWSTNNNTPVITITQPGQYWLQVKDRNNCTGKDSILVNLKECLKGFYMPTAFTPNNDGKNDLLKPILLGNVKQYQLWIYSRWGQVVFETSDLNKGWNGTYKGTVQDGNVFVWFCRYQFEGEPAKTEKGTVVIIR